MMSMQDLHEILMHIKNTSSTKAKTELLKQHLANFAFQRVVHFMYEGTMHFKINKMPPRKNNITDFDEMKLMAFLQTLSEQKGASNADKEKLRDLCSIDPETYELVEMIINKDAKCGFSGKTINKARPGTVFLMPYMRCSKESKKIGNIAYPAIAQEKADGMFVNLIIRNKRITFRTRNGKIIYQLHHLKKLIRKKIKQDKKFNDVVYHGELLVRKKGKILNRATGNGIINSCIQNMADKADAKCVVIKLWDALPIDDFEEGVCNIPYKNRLSRCWKFIKTVDSLKVTKIHTRVVHSYEEARDFYRQMRRLGKEGAILKNMTLIWKDHTSPNAVKMKNVSDADLIIVSWKKGKKKTKYAKMLGSLQCESSCGKVVVSMSGFSDEQRAWDWDEYIGKIVAMEFENITTDKSRPGIYSLYLPQFVELRLDKDTADDLSDIRESLKSGKRKRKKVA